MKYDVSEVPPEFDPADLKYSPKSRTVCYGAWILARYYPERSQIVYIDRTAPMAILDAGADLLKAKFPNWQTTIW